MLGRIDPAAMKALEKGGLIDVSDTTAVSGMRRSVCKECKSNLAIAPLPPVPQTSPEPVTEEIATQRVIDRSTPHKAPHMTDVSEKDPKPGSSQLLGVLGFHSIDPHVDFSTSK